MMHEKRKSNFWLILITVVLAIILIISSVQIIRIYSDYHATDAVNEELLEYKPTETVKPSTDTEQAAEIVPTVTPNTDNPTLLELQQQYPDVRGWLTIDDTNIDYVFAQGENNDTYLRYTLDGAYLSSGTLFLDYRCPADLTGANSIIFGHNMRNHAMFGDLARFADTDYFNEHMSGTLYLPHNTYQLEVVAYMVVAGDDAMVYNPDVSIEEYNRYIDTNARQLRSIPLGENDTLLTLSTCNYEYDGARSVVIVWIVRNA